MPLTSPRLWIVATPIGNPGDLSPRAREILASADLALVEDTRRAARMFRECGISAPKMLSFFEHNEAERIPQVLEALRKGASVAIVTDAGTPVIADPGYRLINACRKEGIPVSPVPGPSAPVAALSCAGIPPIPYTFLGFLPRSASGIDALFTSFAEIRTTLIFFERKDRLCESLALALPVLGNRRIAICRELTKTHEEFIVGELNDHEPLCAGLLGEITVIIGPPEVEKRTPRNKVEEILTLELAGGLKSRQAALACQARCKGWTAKEIYGLIASIKSTLR